MAGRERPERRHRERVRDEGHGEARLAWVHEANSLSAPGVDYFASHREPAKQAHLERLSKM